MIRFPDLASELPFMSHTPRVPRLLLSLPLLLLPLLLLVGCGQADAPAKTSTATTPSRGEGGADTSRAPTDKHAQLASSDAPSASPGARDKIAARPANGTDTATDSHADDAHSDDMHEDGTDGQTPVDQDSSDEESASGDDEAATPEVELSSAEVEQDAPLEVADAADARVPPAPLDQARDKQAEQQGSTLRIKVADAGGGAPEEELFHDWPKPDALIVLSGEQDGYIEPCGCAGKENQKGGLSRRHTFFNQLRKRDWELVPLDMGGLVRRFGRQTEIKFHTAVDGLRKLNYQAVGYGPGDLKMPSGELISDANELFVSANVGLLGLDAGLVASSRVIEAGGHKIGVTAILGEEYQKEVNNTELEFAPAAQALAKVVPELKKEGCDFLVLLSHATKEESLALAKQFPEFDVVLTAGGASEPPIEPAVIEDSGALLVEVGHKGMYVAALGLYDDPEMPVRFQLVPLDARFADSPEMTDLMAAYQGQLADLGLKGLDIRAASHPSGHRFVGSQRCGDCHTQAHEVWSNTTHAHALDTLVNLNPPRHNDPECLSCHVTGWEPQRFIPFTSGYLDIRSTPLLQHNGCENCHGPGSAHVAAEDGSAKASAEQRDALRKEMRLSLDQADKKCMECHDLDNSPEYVEKGFEHFWPQVEHYGKD
jgi:hypothetical protein